MEKIHKKNPGGRGEVGLVGGQGGCERNVGGRGVMSGVNQE